ncbi:MAG: hypothetical protein KJ058_03025 [Thermoanaerobaculia bacterium]|nr:hypothetical protein [Thermoanaerobaculia bacterium]
MPTSRTARRHLPRFPGLSGAWGKGLLVLLLALASLNATRASLAETPPADAATGIVRFLFEPPPGASPAELCRLVEIRAVRLVELEGAPPREEPAARPAPVRGEPDGSGSTWDRSCRFTLGGLEPGATYRIRARLLPSPWWGLGWEYQEVCPREGGIPATGSPGTHRCEPIRR